jgi:hypothetical protein
VLLLLRFAPPAVVEISLSHLILSHLASHFFNPQVTQTPDGADGAHLHVAHRPKLILAGPEQRRHLPPPGNGLGRVAPMFQGIVVARLFADAVSPSMESTAGPSRHSRRLARRSAPVPGSASRAPMHAKLLFIGSFPNIFPLGRCLIPMAVNGDTGIRQGRRSRNPQSATAVTNFLPGTRRSKRGGRPKRAEKHA